MSGKVVVVVVVGESGRGEVVVGVLLMSER